MEDSDCPEDYYETTYCQDNDAYSDDYHNFYCSQNNKCEETIESIRVEDCGTSGWSEPELVCNNGFNVYEERTYYERGCAENQCYETKLGLSSKLLGKCSEKCVDGQCPGEILSLTLWQGITEFFKNLFS